MIATFIINPVSGPRRDLCGLKTCIEAFIRSRRWQGSLEVSQAPDHARQLAREAIGRGDDMVIAVGGDGTFNEVAREAMGGDTIVGLIPRGSGNGLARHLGIPLKTPQALDNLVTGTVFRMDSASADGRPFFNVMGMGFDAEIGRRFNDLSHRGPLPYFLKSAALLFQYRPQNYIIKNGSIKEVASAWVVAVGNGSQYGNHARIAPSASVADGLLDLTAISLNKWHHLPRICMGLFNGKLLNMPGIYSTRMSHMMIQRDQAGILHTDGEIHPCGKSVLVQVHPRSLNIKIPPSPGAH